MNDFLQRRVLRTPHPLRRALWGAIIALAAVLVRLLLNPVLGEGVPYIAFFPALLLASVFYGAVGGLTCLVLSAVVGGYFFLGPATGDPVAQRTLLTLPVYVLSGGLIVWVSILLRRALLDVYARREQERLLLGELQHRVKNTLAVVQGLAAQTLQASPDPASFKRAFTDRLIALAETHNLLSDAGWGPVGFGPLVEQTLRPFAVPGSGRVVMQGEPLLAPPDHAVSLALCLHELATNATKHGALAHQRGRVEVNWSATPRRDGYRVSLVWQERDGPTVSTPERRGFGSRLLRTAVSSRANPEVSLDFAPGGVRWSLDFDVELADVGERGVISIASA